ncbi:hypothetical protein BJB45_08680 [Halomonas huangheensis]|uniref:Type I secretion protein TolC n=2 Tax=Halomonas huangheensis TaxID=1178482 RepID=W1N8X4_9GAMM|nr:type I secretion protein TolC [Halomonas huangheensis]ERL52027.1 hypothetical protein BJB45_08680 [Halomonas huangheensis]
MWVAWGVAVLCLVSSNSGMAAGVGDPQSRPAMEPPPFPSEATTPLPSLPELFSLALENDSDLASQRYGLEATTKEIDMAWSQLKPQVSAGASYMYQVSDNYYTDNPDYDPGNEIIGADDNEARFEGRTRDASWQVSLTQPLFSLERWRGVDEAEAQVEVSQLELAVGENELAMAVIEAYLNAFLASREVRLMESKRESFELQYRQASRSYELGVGDRLNVLESQARLDQAAADRIKAENSLDSALGELERLTGQRPEFRGGLGNLLGVNLVPVDGNVDDWIARTTENLSVRLAAQQLDVAQANTDVRRSGHYPEVNLSLSYFDRDSNDPYRETRDGRASVEVEVPIYQGGYTSASVRQGELTTLASQESLTHQQRLARQDVRERLRNIDGGLRQLNALSRSMESSRLFLEAAEKGEQLGLRNLVDVLDARAELYDLRVQYVDVVRQYLVDRLGLEVAVGDLGSDDLMRTMETLHALTRGSAAIG